MKIGSLASVRLIKCFVITLGESLKEALVRMTCFNIICCTNGVENVSHHYSLHPIFTCLLQFTLKPIPSSESLFPKIHDVNKQFIKSRLSPNQKTILAIDL